MEVMRQKIQITYVRKINLSSLQKLFSLLSK